VKVELGLRGLGSVVVGSEAGRGALETSNLDLSHWAKGDKQRGWGGHKCCPGTDNGYSVKKVAQEEWVRQSDADDVVVVCPSVSFNLGCRG